MLGLYKDRGLLDILLRELSLADSINDSLGIPAAEADRAGRDDSSQGD